MLQRAICKRIICKMHIISACNIACVACSAWCRLGLPDGVHYGSLTSLLRLDSNAIGRGTIPEIMKGYN